MTKPVGMFPWMTELWRECHEETPLVVIRCSGTAGKGKCRREVGRVWQTKRGRLARLDQTRPGRDMPIGPVGAINETELAKQSAKRNSHFAVMRPDGTGHSKRSTIEPVLIVLDSAISEMLVACPVHGDLQFDPDGALSVCARAQGRNTPLSVWLSPQNL
jgi:hypothetical protein